MTSPVRSEQNFALEKFKEDVKQDGESLILNDFPNKILEINKIMNKPEWNEVNSEIVEELSATVPISDSPNVNNHTAAKKRKVLVNGTDNIVSVNTKIQKLMDCIKPLIQGLVEDANLLKMWLTFMIPKIEDGNNFGVSVQEDILAEIQTVETEADTYYNQISRYYITRGKLVSKIYKYPYVSDYQKGVKEMDEKTYVCLRLIIREIRNRYCILYDVVTKNMEKLKTPRNFNATSLY